MIKYYVRKETYGDELIEDLGELTIEEIENLAWEYSDSVFGNHMGYNTRERIRDCMEYITENGEELWLCGDDTQISIERV